MKIKLENILCRAEGKISTELDGETVILDMESGVYSGLDEVATSVWSYLDEKKTLAQILELLVAEYDVDHETCHTDLQSFVIEMVDAGLITIHD